MNVPLWYRILRVGKAVYVWEQKGYEDLSVFMWVYRNFQLESIIWLICWWEVRDSDFL